MPEARITLSQTAIYLAISPKSNSAYVAIANALSAVKQDGHLPIPLHLRNAPTKLMKDLNYGADYKYSHDFEGNFVHQEFLPDKISGQSFWEPSDNPQEEKQRIRMRKLWMEKYGY